MAWLSLTWLSLDVNDVSAWLTVVVVVSRVEGMSQLHLSSSPLSAEDHRDEAQNKANRCQGPPKPGKIHIVTPAVVLASSAISRAAARVAVVVVTAQCANAEVSIASIDCVGIGATEDLFTIGFSQGVNKLIDSFLENVGDLGVHLVLLFQMNK